MASKGLKFKKIPLEVKLEAVKEKLEMGKTYPYIGKKYGVSRNTVKTWVRIYNWDGGLDVNEKGRPRKEVNIDYKEKYEILKKYQVYLKEVDQEQK